MNYPQNKPEDISDREKFSYETFVNRILSANDDLFLFDYKDKYIPQKLYKYSAFPSDSIDRDKYINALKCEEIWFSKKALLNDPFEFQNITMNFYGNAYNEEYYSELLRGREVFCMAKSCKNKLMWSHYANGHKGYCLEFKVLLPYGIYPVEYTAKCPDYSRLFYKWMTVKDKVIQSKSTNYDNKKLAYALAPISCYKASYWRYENEFRIIHTDYADNNGTLEKMINYDIELTKIICGIQCSAEDKAELISVCKEINKVRINKEIELSKEIPSEWLRKNFYKQNRNVKIAQLWYDANLKLHEKALEV